jgi:hypothetical protein
VRMRLAHRKQIVLHVSSCMVAESYGAGAPCNPVPELAEPQPWVSPQEMRVEMGIGRPSQLVTSIER